MFQGGNIRGAGGWDADKCSRTLSSGSQAHFMGAICELKGFSSPVSSPVDCQLGGWRTAGACSATCGGGVQENTRNVTTEASHGGKACGARSMSLPCNEQPCVGESDILHPFCSQLFSNLFHNQKRQKSWNAVLNSRKRKACSTPAMISPRTSQWQVEMPARRCVEMKPSARLGASLSPLKGGNYFF